MEAQKSLCAKAILRKMNDAEGISSKTSACIPEYSSNKIMVLHAIIHAHQWNLKIDPTLVQVIKSSVAKNIHWKGIFNK